MTPRIAVGALDGTIAMAADTPGGTVSPKLDADSLVTAVPGLDEVASIEAKTLASLPSPSVGPAEVRAALEFAEASIASGADGVVITHGTDTLEETAYLLDLCWSHPEPLVVTGAMRHPEAISADGPANLLAAALTASSPAARDMGVLVCLDDTILAARHVTKSDSTALATFVAPGWGPLGRIVEGQVRMATRPVERFEALPMPGTDVIDVAYHEALLGDDGRQLTAVIASGPRGLVLSGAGGGHVSQTAAEPLVKALDEGLPVVFGTRTGGGSSMVSTYGYPGSEEHLIAHGAIGAGFLHPRKARLLLHVLLEAGYAVPEMREVFSSRGA